MVEGVYSPQIDLSRPYSAYLPSRGSKKRDDPDHAPKRDRHQGHVQAQPSETLHLFLHCQSEKKSE
jgi:hypothetical protein